MLVARHERPEYVFVRADEKSQIDLISSWGPAASDVSTGAFVLPRREETFRKLWWMGGDYRGLAPFYNWTHPKVDGVHQPMEHQLDQAAFMTLHPRCYVLSTPRVGKTGGCVLATEYQRRNGLDGIVLIVCPVSVMHNVWLRTLRAMVPVGSEAVYGSRAERLKILGRGNAHYLIVNFDGLVMLEREFKRMVSDREIVRVIFDEVVPFYGNVGTRRWKAADAVVNRASATPLVAALTGTPATDPRAVYAVARLVNSEQLAYRNLGAWMEAVTYAWGPEPWMRAPRPGAGEIIRSTLQPAVRHRKEDVLPGLPGVEYQMVKVEMTEAQSRAREELREWGRTMVKNQEVDAQKKAALMQKLFQISLGRVRDVDGNDAPVDAAPRMEMLCRLIDSTPAKTVIFGHYVAVNEALTRYLEGRGYSVVKVDGSVGGLKRSRAFSDFQTKKNPRVLVAQPVTTGYGLDFALADKIIFNGPTMSGLSNYLQSVERLSSAKQKADNIIIYSLVTMEEERLFQLKRNDGAREADAIANSFGALVA
jgi:hypothetical protein